MTQLQPFRSERPCPFRSLFGAQSLGCRDALIFSLPSSLLWLTVDGASSLISAVTLLLCFPFLSLVPNPRWRRPWLRSRPRLLTCEMEFIHSGSVFLVWNRLVLFLMKKTCFYLPKALVPLSIKTYDICPQGYKCLIHGLMPHKTCTVLWDSIKVYDCI